MKNIIIAIILLNILGACASPQETAFKNFYAEWDAYGKSVSDGKDDLTVPHSVFFNYSTRIAIKYNQTAYQQIFQMMEAESSKKEMGLPSQIDSLESRLKNQDKSLVATAENYALDASSRQKCKSFGYSDRTPQFEKCVYDLKVSYVNLMLRQQQIILQLTPSPMPIMLPQKTQTTCNPTFGGGFSCTSQ